jgi:tetratricopeptide (TPR) repeat protein
MPQRSPSKQQISPALIASLILLVSSVAEAIAEPEAYGRSAAIPYYNRANRYLNQGRYEEAVGDLEEAIRLYPNDPDFCTNLGVAYRKLGRYADAEREFKTAIAFNREDWMNWSNLANAYLKQDMLEKTVATFEEALKHHPPSADAEAMKRDIVDIKKILASRQNGGNGGTAAKEPSRPSASATTASTRRNAKGKAEPSGVGRITADLKEVKRPVTGLPAAAANSTTSTSASQSNKKNSDWGYDDPK